MSGWFVLPPQKCNNERKHVYKHFREHFCTLWIINQCDHFIHDGARAHDSKIVTKFLNNHNIHVFVCLVIHLTSIQEKISRIFKNKIPETRPSNINELQQELKKLWLTLDSTYFAAPADSMPKRSQMVIKSKAKMTNY